MNYHNWMLFKHDLICVSIQVTISHCIKLFCGEEADRLDMYTWLDM